MSNTFPMVVKSRNTSGGLCYLVQNDKELLSAYVGVLRKWDSYGLIYELDDSEGFTDKERDALNLSDDVIERMHPSMRDGVKKDRLKAQTRSLRSEKLSEMYQNALAVTEAATVEDIYDLFGDNSGKVILEIINAYRDEKYADISVESLNELPA